MYCAAGKPLICESTTETYRSETIAVYMPPYTRYNRDKRKKKKREKH